MIIGIEASHANKLPRTGVENYCFEIIQALKTIIPSDIQVKLYSDTPLQGGLELLPPHWSDVVLKWPLPKLWSQIRLSGEFLRRTPDIFFAPGQLLPFIFPSASVVTIHDSAFKAYPSAYHFWGRQYLKWMNTRIVHHASNIITPSEFSKQELITYYAVAAKKIAVIPEGYNAMYTNKVNRQDEQAVLFQSYDITKPYIITVGRLEEKKNTQRIIQAFDLIRQSVDCQLLLVGKPGVGYSQIKKAINKSPHTKDIRETGYVPTEEIAILLRHAQVFLFPSLYEGFGLPVLEALASGCPVVASSGNSLEEVGGSVALYVDPLNVDEIARQTVRLIQDKDLRKEKIAQGLKRVKLFSWRKAAEEIYHVLDYLK